MKGVRPVLAALGAALAAFLLLSLGCGNGGNKTPSQQETYDEGKVRIEIETLDTGLVKGHAYADAKDGYKVASIKVTATDHKGASWNVLEPETSGFGSPSAQTFFEIVVQEIPRGKQLTVTATATFEDAGGNKVERTATDTWPP